MTACGDLIFTLVKTECPWSHRTEVAVCQNPLPCAEHAGEDRDGAVDLSQPDRPNPKSWNGFRGRRPSMGYQ